MIVRILGEGQYDVPEEALATLNEHDAVVEAAVGAGAAAAFSTALAALLGAVRSVANVAGWLPSVLSISQVRPSFMASEAGWRWLAY